ncbi:MAG: hypothetical protein AAF212_00895 [Verrucomicrobiota bacterium]
MKRVTIILVLLSLVGASFSGCGRTRYENGVKIESGGWLGAVEPEAVTGADLDS